MGRKNTRHSRSPSAGGKAQTGTVGETENNNASSEMRKRLQEVIISISGLAGSFGKWSVITGGQGDGNYVLSNSQRPPNQLKSTLFCGDKIKPCFNEHTAHYLALSKILLWSLDYSGQID